MFLGAFGSWQVGGQKLFESVRNLVGSDILDILESLLSGGEWLIGGELDHLRESFERANGFLNLTKLSSCGIELFLFEEAIS